MKKELPYPVLLFFLFFFSILRAEIIEAPHFHDMYSYVTKDTLILLDIDDTLLIPAQMLGCDEWFKERMAKSSLEKALAEWEAVRHLTKMEIVEKGTEEIVRDLQEQGYVIMGFTTQGTALATRTVQHLNENQINLSLTAPYPTDLYLLVNTHGCLYRKGILFTSGQHKGKAFLLFLKETGLSPKRVLFINDKLSDLQQVEQQAESLEIEFIGLRYAYSDAKKAAFSPQIADYQFHHSTFTHLISDEEAKEKF